MIYDFEEEKIIYEKRLNYNVGNAVDELKCAADMVICHAGEGTIKDLVEKIENGL